MYIGTNSGRLTAVSEPYKLSGYSAKRIDVVCTCGTKKHANFGHFRRQNMKSCGCLRDEVLVARNTKHGMADTPTNIVWKNLKQRCSNPNKEDWDNYGGRGITVCPEWENSFENFLRDMGERPSPNHTLDRIDNDKGYYKENCRWTEYSTQRHNTRKSKGGYTSKYKGVSRYGKYKWLAKITKDKKIYQVTFDTEVEAAFMYDYLSSELYGDKPNKNIINYEDIVCRN